MTVVISMHEICVELCASNHTQQVGVYSLKKKRTKSGTTGLFRSSHDTLSLRL
jgi:hypothetical protein